MSYRMKLNPNLIYRAKNDVDRLAASELAGVAKNTAYAVLGADAGGLRRIDLKTFPALMIDGLGYTPEELMNMRLGELFSIEVE